MPDWKLVNKCRPHNRNETMRHFIIKAMTFKVLFNEGYWVYTEHDFFKQGEYYKVADVYATPGEKMQSNTKRFVVEIETKPTKKHNEDLIQFYDKLDMNVYIIDVRDVPEDLKEMGTYLKHKLGI